jgi:hypothetical protein
MNTRHLRRAQTRTSDSMCRRFPRSLLAPVLVYRPLCTILGAVESACLTKCTQPSAKTCPGFDRIL